MSLPGQPLVYDGVRGFIHLRDKPEGWNELHIARLARWVLARPRFGGQELLCSGGVVWGSKGRRFGSKGLWG